MRTKLSGSMAGAIADVATEPYKMKHTVHADRLRIRSISDEPVADGEKTWARGRRVDARSASECTARPGLDGALCVRKQEAHSVCEDIRVSVARDDSEERRG